MSVHQNLRQFEKPIGTPFGTKLLYEGSPQTFFGKTQNTWNQCPQKNIIVTILVKYLGQIRTDFLYLHKKKENRRIAKLQQTADSIKWEF